jgi:hypothetical protein
VVGELLASPERRRAMADAARALGRPDAAAAIVDDLIAWLSPEDSGQNDDGEGGAEELPELDEREAPAETGEVPSARGVFPPDAQARRAMARRRSRPRSAAWTAGDRYYGTRAVGAWE